MNKKGRKPKKVEQIDIDSGEFVGLYDSVAEAAKDNYITEETIRKAICKQDGRLPKYQLCFRFVEEV